MNEETRAFLESARVGHLATASAAARPHVVPLCYALVGDSIYFVVDEKRKTQGKRLRRLENLSENPRAALVVDRYDEDWRRLEYVLVRGAAAIVDDAAEYETALERLRGRYPQYRAMRLELGRNPMVRIAAERVHHWKAS